jgi:hypothetical protein
MRLLRLLPLLALALAALLAPTAAHAATPGVNIAGAPTQDRVDEALATGAKQVRIFALWSDFEPFGPADFPAPSDPNQQYFLATFDAAIARINAAGAKPVLVVVGTPGWANGGAGPWVPPTDLRDYASFFGELTARYGTQVAAYEVWNEEDENVFWQPGPDAARYAAMLKSAYAAGKAGNANANILLGPLTGNDYPFLEQLYANGVKGSFDGVSVHTDTACLDRGPDSFYRENGRLARFTFLGYREVRASMLAQGDDKPIWMSELGWTSTGGAANSCSRGTFANQKPDGVSEADQAKFLTQAYGCLAQDPYVVAADWFTLRDTSGLSPNELDHYGLLRVNGDRKPSYAAFAQIARTDGGSPGPCGDFAPPSLSVSSPVEGQQFVGKLDLRASAKDSGVGVARITFGYDGGQKIRNFTDRLTNGASVGLTPWQGSGKLALGPHTIEVTALDQNGNTATRTIHVVKVAAGALAARLTPRFKLQSKVKCKRRTCTYKGRLLRGSSANPSPGGKVAVEWQWRNKQHKWRKLVGGLKPANKAFTFKAKLKKAGKWRVRVVYKGQAPWKKATSKYRTFTVKR